MDSKCFQFFFCQEFLDEHPGGPDVVTALAGKAIRVDYMMRMIMGIRTIERYYDVCIYIIYTYIVVHFIIYSFDSFDYSHDS